jgi:hypothetical protein
MGSKRIKSHYKQLDATKLFIEGFYFPLSEPKAIASLNKLA